MKSDETARLIDVKMSCFCPGCAAHVIQLRMWQTIEDMEQHFFLFDVIKTEIIRKIHEEQEHEYRNTP